MKYTVTAGLAPSRGLTVEAESPSQAARLALPLLFGLSPEVRVDLQILQGGLNGSATLCPYIYQIRYYTVRPFLRWFKRRSVVEDPRFVVSVDLCFNLPPGLLRLAGSIEDDPTVIYTFEPERTISGEKRATIEGIE